MRFVKSHSATQSTLAFFLFLLSSSGLAATPHCSQYYRPYDLGDSYASYLAETSRADCEKDLTVLVFMQADIDLAPFALADLHEMEGAFDSGRKGASSARLDVIVELNYPNTDTQRLHMFQEAPPFDVWKEEDLASKSLRDIRSPRPLFANKDERSLAPIQRLENFIRWAVKTYPSKNYMLVLWGHGRGWQGFGFDDKNPQGMSVKEISKVLATTKMLLPKKSWDLVVSDACLLQTFEVNWELSQHSRFYLGSSQIEDFLGLPYRRLFYEINTRPMNSDELALGLAKLIPTLHQASMQMGGSQFHPRDAKKIRMSLTATHFFEMQSFARELNKLGAMLVDQFFIQDEFLKPLLLQRLSEIPYINDEQADVGVFLNQLEEFVANHAATNSEAQKVLLQIREVKVALNRAILGYGFSGKLNRQENQIYLLGFRGISFYLPVQKEEVDMGKMAGSYVSEKPAELKDWVRFLEHLAKK